MSFCTFSASYTTVVLISNCGLIGCLLFVVVVAATFGFGVVFVHQRDTLSLRVQFGFPLEKADNRDDCQSTSEKRDCKLIARWYIYKQHWKDYKKLVVHQNRFFEKSLFSFDSFCESPFLIQCNFHFA